MSVITAFVHLQSPSSGASSQPRKWHCVAYFSAADWNNLPGVEAYPELRNIIIPDNVYTSTKGTGKTGVPLAMMPMTPDGGNTVGPTRRPLSRGEHSSSPYGASGSTPTLRARQYSFGSSSDVSSSYQSRSPTSTSYDSSGSYTYHSPPPPVPPLPQSQPQSQQQQSSQQKQQAFHQHTSSTSSNSTGSPPTPGFMAPVPSPGSFSNQNQSHSSAAHPFPESKKPLGAPSNSHYSDVVMVDAPSLRTPTKEYPAQSHQNQWDGHPDDRNGYFLANSSAPSKYLSQR
jgi:hypothetical protein